MQSCGVITLTLRLRSERMLMEQLNYNLLFRWFEMLWLVWGARGRMPTDTMDGVATVGGVKTSAICFPSPSVIGLGGTSS
jgi:hypothetical protein